MADDEYTALFKATRPQTSPSAAADNLIDAYRNYKPNITRTEPESTGLQYLLDKAGSGAMTAKQTLMDHLSKFSNNASQGFLERPPTPSQASGFNEDRAGYLAGKYGPMALAGAASLAGPEAGLPTQMAFSGLQAAAMRGAQDAVQGASNIGTPGSAAQKDPKQILMDMAGSGTSQAAGTAIGAVPGKIWGALTKTGAQAMKVSARIPENSGQAVLSDPGILSRAKPLEEVGQMMDGFAQKMGIKTGPAGFEKVFGDAHLTDDMAIKASQMVRKAGEELTPQQAMAARQAISNTLQAPKYLNPKAAMNKSVLIDSLNKADDVIEKAAAEKGLEGAWGGIRTAFRESYIANDFSSGLPLNINKTPSVLGGMIGIGAGAHGAYKASKGEGVPLYDMGAMAASSPFLVGKGIQAGGLAADAGGLMGRGLLYAGADSLTSNPVGITSTMPKLGDSNALNVLHPGGWSEAKGGKPTTKWPGETQ